MINIPCRKYSYKILPMGVSNSPENFQLNMNGLFQVFEFIREYIYDLLMLKFLLERPGAKTGTCVK